MFNLKKFFSSICLMTFLIVFLCPTNVFAAIMYEEQLDSDVKTIITYVEVDQDGLISFDENAAKNDAIDNKLIKIGLQLEEWSLADYNYKQGKSRASILPIYGNWCGPGHGVGNGDPIDIVDAACKAHDECYGEYGYFDCDCDLDLINRINEIEPYLSDSQYEVATLIESYFTIQRAYNLANGNC